MNDLKIGIIGAGAVGGVIATILTEKGYNVEVVLNKKNEFIMDNYVSFDVIGEFGEHSQLVKAVDSVEKFSEKKDIIFITTRANAVANCAKMCAPYLKENGIVVIAGNVLVHQDAKQHIPLSKIISMFVEWSAERINTCKVNVLISGNMKIGVFDATASPFLKIIKALLENIVSTEIVDNMPEFIISRIVMNSAIASIGAVSGLRLGKIIENKNSRKLFYNLIKESINVFDSLNINIPDYLGKLNYYKFCGTSFCCKRYAKKMIKVIGKNNPYLISSILKDLDNNKKSEIDYLTGKICRLAKVKNINVPYSNKIVEIIKEIEDGKRTIYEENIDEVLQAR